jgi:hypothetical protein
MMYATCTPSQPEIQLQLVKDLPEISMGIAIDGCTAAIAANTIARCSLRVDR